MSRLCKEAFAIMAMCQKAKKHFGITVDLRNSQYVFAWAFKIKKEQASREGYDKKHVCGSVTFDADFNGCPYCEAKQFYICHNCGKVVCYHNESYIVCPHCNESADCIGAVDTVELSGGCL